MSLTDENEVQSLFSIMRDNLYCWDEIPGGTLVINCIWRIICASVNEHASHVRCEHLQSDVVLFTFHTLWDCLQIWFKTKVISVITCNRNKFLTIFDTREVIMYQWDPWWCHSSPVLPVHPPAPWKAKHLHARWQSAQNEPHSYW